MPTRALLISILLAGCGGTSKPSTTANTTGTTAPDRPCVHAADHLVDLMSAEAKDAPPEKVKHFKDSFVSHCEADKWSAAMQGCVIDAKAAGDLEKCDSLMTPEQKEALAKEQGTEDAAAAPPPPGGPQTDSTAPDKTKQDHTKTRGPARKNKKTGDPCEGGE